MPHFILQFKEAVVRQFDIPPDRKVRIGRNEENDLQIKDSAVSGIHAEVEPEDGHYYITDFNSRNGTFVNKELIISRRLSHGDIIAIGSHTLSFAYAADEERPSETVDTSFEATMYIDTPHHRAHLARSVGDIAEREIRSNIQAFLTFMNGTGEVFPLKKTPVSIGKDPESDIVIKGWFVGGTAFRIVRKEDGFYLQPENGKPPRVNSRPAKTETMLREFDVIEIGSSSLQFHYGRTDKRNQAQNS